MGRDSTLYAREIGAGLPVLIIHGWGLDGTLEELDFEPVFSTIPNLRRIYVDLPGMGKTPANNVKDLDDMYLRLAHFVDTRLGKSTFLLVGTSCGGYLARALAQKYADQVAGLLLRVPLVQPKNELRDLDPFEPLVRNETLMSSMSAEDKALIGGENVLVQTPAYIESLRAKYGVARAAEKAADNEATDPIRGDAQRYQLSLALDAKLFAPTLILCGRQDDVVGYRDSLRLLELCPRSTFAVLDRAKHDLPVDQNAVFEALVRDWLTRVDEWRAEN
jgi:pimeloyl-ACP methyl ester carboxylesterase